MWNQTSLKWRQRGISEETRGLLTHISHREEQWTTNTLIPKITLIHEIWNNTFYVFVSRLGEFPPKDWLVRPCVNTEFALIQDKTSRPRCHFEQSTQKGTKPELKYDAVEIYSKTVPKQADWQKRPPLLKHGTVFWMCLSKQIGKHTEQ